MKGTRRLEQGYAGLTASERVRLVIAALARDDESEHERLCDSSPKQRYLGCEVAYVDVMQLANEFATGFAAVELGPRAAKLDVLEGTRAVVDELFGPDRECEPDGGEQAGSDDADAALDGLVEVLLDLLDRVADRFATESAEIAGGFGAFCEHELGVDGADMIAAFARPFADTYQRFVAIEGDPAAVSAVCDELCDVWQQRQRADNARRSGRLPAKTEGER